MSAITVKPNRNPARAIAFSYRIISFLGKFIDKYQILRLYRNERQFRCFQAAAIPDLLAWLCKKNIFFAKT
jgi:hypothetical protein